MTPSDPACYNPGERAGVRSHNDIPEVRPQRVPATSDRRRFIPFKGAHRVGLAADAADEWLRQHDPLYESRRLTVPSGLT